MKQNLNFNLDALIVFGKLVECRNLSKAATLLGMPKSTVSRKISKLESDLGVKLLRKNTHQITVTDIGQQVYSHSLKILAEANDVSALIEGNKQEPQGELRAALPIFMGIDYAARVGGSFLQRYPKSQLELRLVDEMVHPIKDGYDVVFGIGLAEPLTVPSQLNKLPFIDFDYYGQPRKSTLTKGKKRYDISPMVRARVNNFQISKDYILRGLGVGIMPKQIICSGELKEGVIVPVLPEWELQSIDVYMIYPFQLSFSNLISAFYDTALEIILQNSSIRS